MTEYDIHDFHLLATQVFKQALDDYIRLQHPSLRTKKYIHESFLEAVDMFWDPTYRLGAFINEDSQPMSLEEFLLLASDRENLDLESFYKFIQSESQNYWKDKLHMMIPDICIVSNVPYDIRHAQQDTYSVDYAQRVILLNKLNPEQSSNDFITAILEIICFHQDIKVSISARRLLATSLCETLKRNNYFAPVKPETCEEVA